MANFSVEWLSQSYYGATQSDAEEMTPDAALLPNGDIVEFTGESRRQQQYSPSSLNNSCGYTSGSESEVGDDSEGEATRRPPPPPPPQQQQQQQQQQQRRIRTKFTSEQISKLENTFDKHKYLGATQRRRLAEKLNLSETQVKTWFQNRRMKMKREVQDLRPCDFLPDPAALLPPALFQHRGLSGQLPGFYPRLQPLQPLRHHHHRAGLSPPPPSLQQQPQHRTRPGAPHTHFY